MVEEGAAAIANEAIDEDAVPNLDDEDDGEFLPVPTAWADDGASAAGTLDKKGRKAQRRVERAQRRKDYQGANLRELRALCEALDALPASLPALAYADQQAATPMSPAVSEPAQNGTKPKFASKWNVPDEAEVEARLSAAEAVLAIPRPYRSLPEAFGPAEAIDVLSGLLIRPPKYQAKMLPQEVSLLAKIWALGTFGEEPYSSEAGNLAVDSAAVAGARTPLANVVDFAVVDIGAGNGYLALLAAIVLNGYAVLIDHTLPPDELRVELKVPEPYRSRVLRITLDIANVHVSRDLLPLLRRHGVRRAVVVAKHLCGLGTDLAEDFVRSWCRICSNSQSIEHELESDDLDGGGCTPRLLGAALATCCGHKIGAADQHTYSQLHAGDPYLCALTGGDEARLANLVTTCTRCVSWRTTAGNSSNRITPSQVRTAELFEDVLQQPRLNLLRSLFPAAEEVAFVPFLSSPQNRCLLGGSSHAVREATQECFDSEAFLASLRAASVKLLEDVGGPLDLKPRGFVSPKYDYDGT